MPKQFSKIAVTPDWEGLVRCLRRQGPPCRVHCLELFLDGEVQTAVANQFALTAAHPLQQQINIQRFLGYDYVRAELDNVVVWPLPRHKAGDTAGLARATGRSFIENVRGPISNWEEF